MTYSLVNTRFYFFDGKDRFTVEYTHSLRTWYIFKDDGHSDAIYINKVKGKRRVLVNWIQAYGQLLIYLNTIIA